MVEEAKADDAAAGPRTREVSPQEGSVKVGLIPEQHLAAGCRTGVDPLPQELSGVGMVRTRGADPPPIREYLPRLRMVERKAREGLA